MLWLAVIAIGLITFAYRVSFILFAHRLRLPANLQHSLRFVPIAALTAIIVPELVMSSGQLDLGLDNSRLLAGLLAAIVAWRTRNVLLTIVCGMAVLWLHTLATGLL